MIDGPDYFGAGQAPHVYPNSAGEPPVGRRTVDERKLWTGGIMAAVVAALVAAVGLLLVRGIADVPVFVQRDGELVDASMWWYAGAAASGAIVATILLNVLLLWAPRPYLFFGWILGLAVVIATLVPYTFDAALGSKVATSAINLAVGVCISSILVGVGRSAARIPESPRGY